jgi:hypothetical protein
MQRRVDALEGVKLDGYVAALVDSEYFHRIDIRQKALDAAVKCHAHVASIRSNIDPIYSLGFEVLP